MTTIPFVAIIVYLKWRYIHFSPHTDSFEVVTALKTESANSTKFQFNAGPGLAPLPPPPPVSLHATASHTLLHTHTRASTPTHAVTILVCYQCLFLGLAGSDEEGAPACALVATDAAIDVVQVRAAAATVD